MIEKTTFAAALARLRHKAGSNRRSRRHALQQMPRLQQLAPQPVAAPDPVSVAIFAIDRVGPAAVRACASGVEVRVTAPDEAIAAVLRAALVETARRRATDRLIRIVVD